MIVPGSNLLRQAFGMIARQPVQWLQFQGITKNEAFVEVPAWAAPVNIAGSFQPIDRNLYQTLGLDWTKNYANFYDENTFKDVTRDITGDRLIYAGKTYQIESKQPWFTQDGWEKVLCVEVTNA